jgi:release factor glutamine methyltransferase
LQAALALGLERLDAQLLLLHALGRAEDERAWLLAHDDSPLDEASAATFRALTLRRIAGEPLAYIVGYREFFGLKLTVDPRVLVPRPDTETLVEWALNVLRTPGFAEPARVLDLGTGSGAIALALVHRLLAGGPTVEVVAVDASPDALAVATGNAAALGLPVQFGLSNWLEQVGTNFHLIVSNPPYIAMEDSHLTALTHEPLQALAAGPDGLDDLRRIIRGAPDHLETGGWLLLEHGYDQSQPVCQLLLQRGFVQVQSRPDLAGIARCTGGQWPA